MPNQASPEIAAPSPHNWRTTDEDEINRHRARARTEEFRISNTDARHPIFSNFRVRSGSGLTYSGEVRDVRQRQFACDCVDFRINGLGTCKHVEAVLPQLQARLDFLNPSLLGSLFRFNREYYDLDDRGRPAGYRNLDKLHERIKPHMLRRRKADVETELPERSDRNFFVPLSAEQQGEYEAHEHVVAQLATFAKRHPLTQHIPDKGAQMVRYYGWYSNKMRGVRQRWLPPELVVRRPGLSPPPPLKLPSKGWRDLILRVWHVDPLRCPVCQGPMRVIAVIDDPRAVEKILRHLGAWHDPLAGLSPPGDGGAYTYEPCDDADHTPDYENVLTD